MPAPLPDVLPVMLHEVSDALLLEKIPPPRLDETLFWIVQLSAVHVPELNTPAPLGASLFWNAQLLLVVRVAEAPIQMAPPLSLVFLWFCMVMRFRVQVAFSLKNTAALVAEAPLLLLPSITKPLFFPSMVRVPEVPMPTQNIGNEVLMDVLLVMVQTALSLELMVMVSPSRTSRGAFRVTLPSTVMVVPEE